MKKILFIALLFVSSLVKAQELNCQVQVVLGQNVQQSSVDKSVFTQLEQSVRDFMNNKKWTKEVYALEERIECNVILQIDNVVGTEQFSGSIQVTSRRPIYNTSYFSTIFNHKDADFSIRYLRNTRLEFVENTFTNNLSSILAYYAYMFIGYDRDTYKLEGGNDAFTKAQQIVTDASNSGQVGWKASESQKNRYWIVENALHQAFKPMRKAYYEYHRLGFDKLFSEMPKGRAAVVKALEYIRNVNKVRPGSINVQGFFSAKSTEIINLFSQSFPKEKAKVVAILKGADPINSSKYDKILKNN